MIFAAKTLLAALIISFASWLAGKRPELAGFIIALPLSTLLALAFSYAEFKDPASSVIFAKSIFVAIPVTMFFFVPFLAADRFAISFPVAYVSGIALLGAGYFLHRWIAGWF
ncbi:MAG: hypothetical protein EP340_11510 [Alphaproteobacteria bacterium]|nr:MAG: hypothetical protein EP340_11510 [Alphaproteobacteria bacterium]